MIPACESWGICAKKLAMLYDRWLRISGSWPNEIALADLSSGRRWTFRELSAEVGRGQDSRRRIAFASGSAVDFILSVLRAWKADEVVCPLEPGQAEPVVPGSLPRGVAHLKTTSATTGLPRMVAFTAPQLMADAENIVVSMGLRRGWPNLGVISLAHSYGFSNLVLPLLLHGVPLWVVGATLPEALRQAAAGSSQVFTLAAVPALWRAWSDAEAIPANIRLAISAGAPLPLSLERAVFDQYGLKLHNFYGSSECGGIAYDSSRTPRADSACVGAPLKNVEVSIGDDGCIRVSSPAVASGYLPQSSPRLGAGLFHSNDLGELIQGEVWLRGRACDQINVAGRKVLPEIIEEALAEHPQVSAVLAFGVPSPDTRRGESIVACVAGQMGMTSESLRQFALAKLAAWQVPRDWWLVRTLEANGRGKLSRSEWRQKYLEMVEVKMSNGAAETTGYSEAEAL